MYYFTPISMFSSLLFAPNTFRLHKIQTIRFFAQKI